MLRLTRLLKEQIVDNKVICNKCGWKWSITDGGNDPYTCHKCGNNNTPIEEGGISGLEKRIKTIAVAAKNEDTEVEQGHENDRDMVVGVAEILRMVNDMGNRKDIADKMIEKFNSENVMFNKEEFLKLSGI